MTLNARASAPSSSAISTGTRWLRSPAAMASVARSSVCTGRTSRRASPTANPVATSSASVLSVARLSSRERVRAMTSRIG